MDGCLQVCLLANHFWTRSRRQRLTLSLQMIVPGCFCFFLSFIVVHFVYPAYNKRNKYNKGDKEDIGKLLIALFTPLIGVVVKPILRICVQQLYNITHPGYSYVLLSPLYFGSAVMFRVLQADLHGLNYNAIVSALTVAYIRRIHYEFALFSRTPVSCTRLVVLF